MAAECFLQGSERVAWALRSAGAQLEDACTAAGRICAAAESLDDDTRAVAEVFLAWNDVGHDIASLGSYIFALRDSLQLSLDQAADEGSCDSLRVTVAELRMRAQSVCGKLTELRPTSGSVSVAPVAAGIFPDGCANDASAGRVEVAAAQACGASVMTATAGVDGIGNTASVCNTDCASGGTCGEGGPDGGGGTTTIQPAMELAQEGSRSVSFRLGASPSSELAAPSRHIAVDEADPQPVTVAVAASSIAAAGSAAPVLPACGFGFEDGTPAVTAVGDGIVGTSSPTVVAAKGAAAVLPLSPPTADCSGNGGSVYDSMRGCRPVRGANDDLPKSVALAGCEEPETPSRKRPPIPQRSGIDDPSRTLPAAAVSASASFDAAAPVGSPSARWIVASKRSGDPGDSTGSSRGGSHTDDGMSWSTVRVGHQGPEPPCRKWPTPHFSGIDSLGRAASAAAFSASVSPSAREHVAKGNSGGVGDSTESSRGGFRTDDGMSWSTVSVARQGRTSPGRKHLFFPRSVGVGDFDPTFGGASSSVAAKDASALVATGIHGAPPESLPRHNDGGVDHNRKFSGAGLCTDDGMSLSTLRVGCEDTRSPCSRQPSVSQSCHLGDRDPSQAAAAVAAIAATAATAPGLAGQVEVNSEVTAAPLAPAAEAVTTPTAAATIAAAAAVVPPLPRGAVFGDTSSGDGSSKARCCTDDEMSASTVRVGYEDKSLPCSKRPPVVQSRVSIRDPTQGAAAAAATAVAPAAADVTSNSDSTEACDVGVAATPIPAEAATIGAAAAMVPRLPRGGVFGRSSSSSSTDDGMTIATVRVGYKDRASPSSEPPFVRRPPAASDSGPGPPPVGPSAVMNSAVVSETAEELVVSIVDTGNLESPAPTPATVFSAVTPATATIESLAVLPCESSDTDEVPPEPRPPLMSPFSDVSTILPTAALVNMATDAAALVNESAEGAPQSSMRQRRSAMVCAPNRRSQRPRRRATEGAAVLQEIERELLMTGVVPAGGEGVVERDNSSPRRRRFAMVPTRATPAVRRRGLTRASSAAIYAASAAAAHGNQTQELLFTRSDATHGAAAEAAESVSPSRRRRVAMVHMRVPSVGTSHSSDRQEEQANDADNRNHDVAASIEDEMEANEQSRAQMRGSCGDAWSCGGPGGSSAASTARPARRGGG
eukprot:TRINITY_DN8374_c0_g1_i2.p1 TRINITY_DN8374_c0_g1~~TRINITY_DN8374_c0_g1_i2.p1  ORF type:complete len:1192 (+),score=239.22 TRINITY_DN8374_c0_g1_i2:78-3578(+)